MKEPEFCPPAFGSPYKPSLVEDIKNKRKTNNNMSDEQQHWYDVATRVATHTAGVKWTDVELSRNAAASCNTQGYSDRKDSTVKRFFDTISEYGGPELEQLSQQYKDDFGNWRRYVYI